MNGAYCAAVDSPARLCRRVIKGRQQRVLPPPVYHKCSPSTMHKPLRKGGISMTCTEEYKEHIEYTFHAFCKVVIRNAIYTAVRTRNRKNKRNIP